MTVYKITKDSIAPVRITTLAAEGFRERYDLQRLLRENISVVAPDTYVLAEEYGEWEDAKRRIDLLCLDQEANLVVIELKRTEDGGHMDLQAIRYAAMVSTMTFAQAVEAHANYLRALGREDDAQSAILKFLDWDEPRESEFARDTRIILVSGEFSKEITTAVLWLNDRELDIRCVRLRPYTLESQTLLDIQQVIPLPEATEYQVQVRKKAAEKRQSEEGGQDWTRYDLTVGEQRFENLYKRGLFFRAIQAIIRCGITPEGLMDFMPESKFLVVPGKCSADEFRAKASQMKNASGNPFDLRRFFIEDEELFFVGGNTYALSNQWSIKRLPLLDALIAKYPQARMSYEKSSSPE